MIERNISSLGKVVYVYKDFVFLLDEKTKVE